MARPDEMLHNGRLEAPLLGRRPASNEDLPEPPGPPLGEPELPPLSDEDLIALAEFHKKQEVVRALTLSVLQGCHPGAHLWGPPGVSKTFTVHKTLRERKAPWRLHQRITAKPLYLELAKDPGAVHVINDCSQLFGEKSALTLLLSALGGETVRGRRERLVSYSVSGSRARVMEHYFFGAIIFTSNRPLADEVPEVAAILSRIPSVCFSPTDREIRAVMRHAARQGFVGECGSMSPAECVEVVEYVIQTAGELKCRLDLRWIEHGYGHYLTEAAGGGRVDWRDMTKFHMLNTVTYFDHTPPARRDDADAGEGGEKDTKMAIAVEISQIPDLTGEERVRLWEGRTGRSRPSFYRWLDAARKKQVRGESL